MLLVAVGVSILRGQDTVKDYAAVLTKDYYSYAEQHNLRLDFVRSIDYESWETLRKSQSGGASLFDVFSFHDDYATFSQKRSKYLETFHYTRSEEHARSILQITTAERAYPAYEHCLETVSGGVRH